MYWKLKPSLLHAFSSPRARSPAPAVRSAQIGPCSSLRWFAQRISCCVLAIATALLVGCGGSINGTGGAAGGGGLSASPETLNTSGPLVGIAGDRFTLNGVPTFLLGVSYFDALGWKTSDFDMLAARKFNLIRVWLDWGVSTDRSRSFFDADGNLVRVAQLLGLVRAAAARGIVVDVTILDSDNASGAGNPENAVRNAMRALSGEPNVFFDLVNEHSRSPVEWSIDHARLESLVGIAHATNPKALVTLSAVENHYIENGVGVDLEIGLNLLAPHFARGDGVSTAVKVSAFKSSTVLPVYLQEENRRGWQGDFSLTKADFLKAAGEAVTAGAAGWVFHTAAGFDLSASSFFDNLDDVERATVDALGDVVFPVIPES